MGAQKRGSTLVSHNSHRLGIAKDEFHVLAVACFVSNTCRLSLARVMADLSIFIVHESQFELDVGHCRNRLALCAACHYEPRSTQCTCTPGSTAAVPLSDSKCCMKWQKADAKPKHDSPPIEETKRVSSAEASFREDVTSVTQLARLPLISSFQGPVKEEI